MKKWIISFVVILVATMGWVVVGSKQPKVDSTGLPSEPITQQTRYQIMKKLQNEIHGLKSELHFKPNDSEVAWKLNTTRLALAFEQYYLDYGAYPVKLFHLTTPKTYIPSECLVLYDYRCSKFGWEIRDGERHRIGPMAVAM